MTTQYDRELKAWEDLVSTRNYHAQFGRTLLVTAYALLETVPILEREKRVDINPNTIKMLKKFADINIEKAVKIETEARADLLELQKKKPERL